MLEAYYSSQKPSATGGNREEKAMQYAPVPTTDPIAPDYLLKFISCNYEGDCSTRRCSCKKQGVKSISACGKCNGQCISTRQTRKGGR